MCYFFVVDHIIVIVFEVVLMIDGDGFMAIVWLADDKLAEVGDFLLAIHVINVEQCLIKYTVLNQIKAQLLIQN